MSRPQVQRPSARPSAAPVSKGPDAGAINALPEFEDNGTDLDLDPSKANDGGFAAGDGTDAVIASAKFAKFQFPGRDDIPAQVRLFLEFQTAGHDTNKKEQLKYADFAKFAASKDGNTIKVRPSAIKENKDGSKYIPNLYKYDQGVLFMQSVKDAGISAEKINKEGLKCLIGLKVHVSRRKVSGQVDNAKAALLVDYIDGMGTVNAAPAATKPAAPAAGLVQAHVETETVAANDEVSGLAEAALLDVLGVTSPIAFANIAAAIIRIPKWVGHAQRGPVLKTLRDNENAFIKDATRDGVLWVVDGVTVAKI